MRFRDVRSQDRALALLRRALQSGRTPHAYLFEGPEGVGKELAAAALAARLLCLNPSSAEACGACESCRLFAARTHPDYHLVHRGLHKRHPDRAVRVSKGLFLAVDVIRQFLIEPATRSPSLSARRVFTLRDAERMNEGAQNALLKTLEEPPGQACLVLVASSADRLLATIRSRCQRVPFGLLPEEFVRQKLAEAGADPQAAAALASLAEGSVGAALRWLRADVLATLGQLDGLLKGRAFEGPERFGKRVIELAEELAPRLNAGDDEEESDDDPRGAAARGRSAKAIPTDQLREALKLTLRMLAAALRDALRISVGAAPALGRASAAAEALRAGAAFDLLDARISAVARAEEMFDRNVAPQLALERLACALSGDLAPV